MQQLKSKASSRHLEFIQLLKRNGVIKSPQVYDCMAQVDRGDYVSTNPYVDSPQLIGYNVTISAPHMHVAALELLKDHLKTATKVLDVGSGTGYLTVAFYKMMQNKKGVSYGVDHVPQLIQESITNISRNDKDLIDNKNVQVLVGDGRQGLSEYGPFDCIHVGASTDKIPQPLLDQLANGGRMLIPVGTSMGQQFLIVDKDQNGNVKKTSAFGVRYVPLTSLDKQCPGIQQK